MVLLINIAVKFKSRFFCETLGQSVFLIEYDMVPKSPKIQPQNPAQRILRRIEQLLWSSSWERSYLQFYEQNQPRGKGERVWELVNQYPSFGYPVKFIRYGFENTIQ